MSGSFSLTTWYSCCFVDPLISKNQRNNNCVKWWGWDHCPFTRRAASWPEMNQLPQLFCSSRWAATLHFRSFWSFFTSVFLGPTFQALAKHVPHQPHTVSLSDIRSHHQTIVSDRLFLKTRPLLGRATYHYNTRPLYIVRCCDVSKWDCHISEGDYKQNL